MLTAPQRRLLPGLLACLLATAGCGHSASHATATVPVPAPAPAQKPAVGATGTRLEECHAEDASIKKQNRSVEQHNNEVRAGEIPGPALPLQIEKLCLPPERHPPRFETLAVVERQLAAEEVRSAVIVKRDRRLHITLRTGQTAAIEYARHQEAAVVRELHRAGVPITVE